jgi:hypothetical protein
MWTIDNESRVARTLRLMPWSSFTTRVYLTAPTDSTGAENSNAVDSNKFKDKLNPVESTMTTFRSVNRVDHDGVGRAEHLQCNICLRVTTSWIRVSFVNVNSFWNPYSHHPNLICILSHWTAVVSLIMDRDPPRLQLIVESVYKFVKCSGQQFACFIE